MAGFDNDTVFGQQGLDIGAHPSTGTPRGSFEFADAGSEVKVQIRNTSNTASSDALQEIRVAGAASGVAYSRIAVADTGSFALGMNGSEPSNLYLTYKADGSATPSTYDNRIFRIVNIVTGQDSELILANQLSIEPTGATGDSRILLSNTNPGLSPLIQFSQTSAADDATVVWNTGNGANWRLGTYGTGSGHLYITQKSTGEWPPDATNTVAHFSSNGEVTFPLTSAFLATHTVLQGNVTGNGTTATVNFTTEIYDQNADYDATNTFTAPVTGRYYFSASVGLYNVGAATSGQLTLVTSNRTYFLAVVNPSGVVQADGVFSWQGSVIADMDASDTAKIQVVATGMGVDTINLNAEAKFYFCGKLEC